MRRPIQPKPERVGRPCVRCNSAHSVRPAAQGVLEARSRSTVLGYSGLGWRQQADLPRLAIAQLTHEEGSHSVSAMDHACTVFVDTYSSIDQPVRSLSPPQYRNTQTRKTDPQARRRTVGWSNR